MIFRFLKVLMMHERWVVDRGNFQKKWTETDSRAKVMGLSTDRRKFTASFIRTRKQEAGKLRILVS